MSFNSGSEFEGVWYNANGAKCGACKSYYTVCHSHGYHRVKDCTYQIECRQCGWKSALMGLKGQIEAYMDYYTARMENMDEWMKRLVSHNRWK